MVWLIIFAVLVAVVLWAVVASGNKQSKERDEEYLEWVRRTGEK